MASRPISPTETTNKHPPPIQPNAHPYAIKTTSSALLSRSNTSPHTPHDTRHHYVPPSFSQVPTGMMARHRHSFSLPSIKAAEPTPAPLPVPPSVTAALLDNPPVSLEHGNEPKLTHRVRRAETMPSSGVAGANRSCDQKHEYSHDQDSMLELYSGLPPNPKHWDTDELTTYLERSLRLVNNTDVDEDEDDSSVPDILEYVRTRDLTGRGLLRLADAELANAPLSDAQRAQLLQRSHTLRVNVLRGRIYGDSYHSHEISDNSNEVYSRSARPSTLFHNIHAASVSVDDIRVLLDNNSGEQVVPPSPIMSLRRSNSVSEASAQRYRDLARMRMRRRGKVKGLVETWERASTSESECSASEEGSVSEIAVDSESEPDAKSEPISDTKHFPESLMGQPSALLPEPSHDAPPSVTNSMVVPQEPRSFISTPPYTRVHTTPRVVAGEEEEPSVEELLASSSNIPLKGARAWEADFCLGDTVKRVPVSLGTDAGDTSSLVLEPDTSHPETGDGPTREDSSRFKGSVTRAGTGGGGKNANIRKRVVTAIFTGPPSGDVFENVGGETNSVDRHRHASQTKGIVHDMAAGRSDPQDDLDSAIRTLEESVAVARAQVEGFRLRLEAVEADTAREEARLERAQHSDTRFELRRRRSEADEHASHDTDETPVEGFGVRDVLDVLKGWKTMSTKGITRATVAKAMGWVFPYERLVTTVREDRDQCPIGSCPGVNGRHPTLVKRSGRLSLVRMSCSIILVSFALCAALLRKLGLERWARRP